MKAATASPVLLPTLFSSSPIIIISSRLAVFLLLLLMTFSPFAYAKRILLQTSRPTAFVGIAPVCKQRRFYNNNSCLHCHLQLQLSIPTAQDMEDLGAILSMDTSAGDVLCLQGDLGAGKTCLSRGFIQTRTHNNDNDKVTSPTYLLTNTYPTHDGIMQVQYTTYYYYIIIYMYIHWNVSFIHAFSLLFFGSTTEYITWISIDFRERTTTKTWDHSIWKMSLPMVRAGS